MQRDAVRVQQPDGSFKVIFRENPGNQKDQEKKKAEGYFNFEMLNRRFVVKKGIAGIDPDVH